MKAFVIIVMMLVGAAPLRAAVELNFAARAELSFSETKEFASYKLPIGPYADGRLPTLVAEGKQVQSAWHVQLSGGTTLGVMDTLRQQIEAVGFELLFECETRECGGFDFRFQTDVLPEPDMHVDLGDFRYLSAQRLGEAVPEYLSLMVSRSITTGYVQLIHIGAASADPVTLKSGTRTDAASKAILTQNFGSIVEMLESNGSAVLEDLSFATGSSTLGEGKFLSLIDLSAYLLSNPERSVALVGHTDAQGSLEANVALSRKRAQSVAARLTSEFGVSASQLQADGVGYLAPRASNLTEDGRTLNRRVEVVLTSTQ